MTINSQSPITLANCAHEPIHIPGSIQPHGALLVFNNTLQLISWSENARALLGLPLTLHASIESLALNDDILDALKDTLVSMEDGEIAPIAVEARYQESIFDVVIHTHLNRIIIEFERRELSSDAVASFALKAHRAIDRLKRQKNLNALLQVAVEEIQKLTGFDRVMAYMFRHDDSGDVVAEKRRDDLDAYIGRRYPASDIPAQARRLYTLNTLRLIADINYKPVPLVGEQDGSPLDMSHCILRSVSPIHIEYLQNMGVGASMSVSIIVNGRLWGMLACHHMSALQIPYSIRMACDVIAQIIASNVVSLQEHARAELNAQASKIRIALVETLLNEDDVLRAFSSHAEALKQTLAADAIAVSQQGKLMIAGDIPLDIVAEIHELLPSEGDDLVLWQSRSEWPQALQALIDKWVGLLALRFDPVTNGWILAFRLEQIETVNWGGKPEKDIKPGPLGPRLTPRGSFDEWKEIVRDSAEPWDTMRLETARDLLSALLRVSNQRHAETDRARVQLMAILGHDLRDPLNSINLAAHFIKEDGEEGRMGNIIRNSSSRMERLISQVLDMSRLGTGIGLSIRPTRTNVIAVLNNLIDEARVAHPGVNYRAEVPDDLHWSIDADRLAQAVGNLLSNARHHGQPNASIRLTISHDENNLMIEVSNEANEIDPDVVANLFSPFKKSSSTRGRAGLGLGLYIAKEIITGHQGELTYHYQEPHVIFRVVVPA